MVKLASARESRMYGPRLARNRSEYINAGLYLFATVVLIGGFVGEFSREPRSGLVLLIIALTLIIIVNLHDMFAHLAAIDGRLVLMEFDPQLALVEFAVPLVQALGSLLMLLGILFIFVQEEKGYGLYKLEKHAMNMLIAGPVLWVVGSIHNSCQIYERADGHVQILQQSVHIPLLMGSLLFMVAAIYNARAQARFVHHGLPLLGTTWVWLGICGSIMFFIGGLTNVVKVFKMQQLDGGLRLEKLRGGAHERLIQAREGELPLILEENRRRRHQHHPVESTSPPIVPVATPYKDVLIGHS
ncbi:hypothetical protein ACFE04_011041 [Oxalis oulophora]